MPSKKPKIDAKIGAILQDTKELEDDLFDVNSTKGLVNISIERLTPNPNQPRKTFYEETITELAESIREQGLLSPIIVRPEGKRYQIIAGERRYKAAVIAGLEKVPALIKKVSDGEARIISLVENIQREDLNDLDRASAMSELKVTLGISWEQLAQKLGLTKRRVLDLVGLLDLPNEIKNEIREKRLTERHGRALRQVLDKPDVLRDVYHLIKDRSLTGEQSFEIVKIVKGEPRFTIEEAYDRWKETEPKKEKVKRGPVEMAILESVHLTKTLEKIDADELDITRQEMLKDTLIKTLEKIQTLLSFLSH
jgi:ParB family chromosome partitioning protein